MPAMLRLSRATGDRGQETRQPIGLTPVGQDWPVLSPCSVSRRTPAADARRRAAILRRQRRGLSLTEVLISTFVVVVGLLSLAALLPVGMHEVAMSVRADAASAVGRAAWKQIKVHDMLRPVREDGQGLFFQPRSTSAPYFQQYVCESDQNDVPEITPVQVIRRRLPDGSVRRILPFAIPDTGAFVIDPYGLSRVMASNSTVARELAVFPCMRPGDNTVSSSILRLPRLTIGRPNNGILIAPFTSQQLQQIPPTYPSSALQESAARMLVTSTDDPSFGDADEALIGRPQRVVVDMNGNPTNTLNQNAQLEFGGQYTWFITVNPILGEQPKDAVRPNPCQDDSGWAQRRPFYWRRYEASVAVVHRRPLPATSTSEGDHPFPRQAECRASVRFTTGLGGGDVTLTWSNESDPDRVPRLRPGNWILLYQQLQPVGSGSAMNNSLREFWFDGAENAFNVPVPIVAKWYRIVGADDGPVASGTSLQRNLMLQGPDWPMDPNCTPYLTENAFAVTMDGVVGVFTKTVELE